MKLVSSQSRAKSEIHVPFIVAVESKAPTSHCGSLCFATTIVERGFNPSTGVQIALLPTLILGNRRIARIKIGGNGLALGCGLFGGFVVLETDNGVF